MRALPHAATLQYGFICSKQTLAVYLMFVDDSGSTRPHRAGARERGTVHVLGSMIVHEHDLHNARLAINDAKRDLFAGSDPGGWELHAYDVWNNRGDFSGEDRSRNLAKKKEVFSRAVEGIVRSGATLASVVVWKSRLPGGLGSTRIRALAWRLLVERFEAYLGAGGGVDLGTVISDESNPATEGDQEGAPGTGGEDRAPQERAQPGRRVRGLQGFAQRAAHTGRRI